MNAGADDKKKHRRRHRRQKADYSAPIRSLLEQEPARRHVIVVLALFSVVAFWLVKSSRGAPATIWMTIYRPADFPTVGSMISFILGLRVPIPPLISALEILNHILAGNTDIVTVGLYRLALVLAFAVAITLSGSSHWRMAGSFALSVVFLWATTVIHPGNPQVYDIFYPCCILLYVLFLAFTISSVSGKSIYAFSAASGFFLSMAELTRPFVFVFLPVVLFCTYCALRKLPRRYLGCFLAPMLLFSGSCHLHQALRHGQVTWSNHSGYNLARAWSMAPTPTLIPEPDNAPIRKNRLPNLNTKEHGQNSKQLTEAVLSYIVTHPLAAGRHMVGRLVSFLYDVQTSIYKHRPEHAIFNLYRPLVWLSSTWLVAGVCLLGVRLVRSNGYRLTLLGTPDNILLLLASMSIAILSVGESGREQARFLISVLPFLAALPQFEQGAHGERGSPGDGVSD